MFKPNLLFAIDVSGTPYKETIISCVSFNIKNSPQVLDEFNRKFKSYKNKKGKDLTHEKLKEILQFLDNNKIRSSCVYFTANDWNYALSFVPKNKAYQNKKYLVYFITVFWRRMQNQDIHILFMYVKKILCISIR